MPFAAGSLVSAGRIGMLGFPLFWALAILGRREGIDTTVKVLVPRAHGRADLRHLRHTHLHAVNALAARLRERIAASGPISFSAFMESALYDAEDGFYARGARLGARGAFTTAPIATRLPRARAGRRPARAVGAAGAPGAVHASPRSARATARWRPASPPQLAGLPLDLVLCERSAGMLAQARQRAPGARVAELARAARRGRRDRRQRGARRLPGAPPALARRAARRRRARPALPRSSRARPPAALGDALTAAGVTPREGAEYEVAPAQAELQRTLARALARGALIVLDYGEAGAARYERPVSAPAHLPRRDDRRRSALGAGDAGHHRRRRLRRRARRRRGRGAAHGARLPAGRVAARARRGRRARGAAAPRPRAPVARGAEQPRRAAARRSACSCRSASDGPRPAAALECGAMNDLEQRIADEIARKPRRDRRARLRPDPLRHDGRETRAPAARRRPRCRRYLGERLRPPAPRSTSGSRGPAEVRGPPADAAGGHRLRRPAAARRALPRRRRRPQSLLLNGHIDVVTARAEDGWTRRPVRRRVVARRPLYGRGSCDMKGGIASMVVAAEALARAGLRLARRPRSSARTPTRSRRRGRLACARTACGRLRDRARADRLRGLARLPRQRVLHRHGRRAAPGHAELEQPHLRERRRGQRDREGAPSCWRRSAAAPRLAQPSRARATRCCSPPDIVCSRSCRRRLDRHLSRTARR